MVWRAGLRSLRGEGEGLMVGGGEARLRLRLGIASSMSREGVDSEDLEAGEGL